MTSHRVTYEGPPGHAVRAATLLADADGVELTSAGKPRPGGRGEPARLTMTVEGTIDAVRAAVRTVVEGLPAGARMTLDDENLAGG